MECELRLTTRDSHCLVGQFSPIGTEKGDSQEVRSTTHERAPARNPHALLRFRRQTAGRNRIEFEVDTKTGGING